MEVVLSNSDILIDNKFCLIIGKRRVFLRSVNVAKKFDKLRQQMIATFDIGKVKI